MNLRTIERFSGEAAAASCEFACFPELSISGYLRDRSSTDLAEPIPGPSTDQLVRIATNTGMTILAGLLEQGADGVYNTQVIAEPHQILGVQRKLYVPSQEAEGFIAGHRIGVFESKDLIFGVEVCYDAHFPELSTALALLGADAIFMPHASSGGEDYREKRDRWMRFLPARAYDNSVYIAVCNQAGLTGTGEVAPGITFVCDPLGRIVAESGGPDEQLVVAELRHEELVNARANQDGYFLRYRRPELYGQAIEPSVHEEKQ